MSLIDRMMEYVDGGCCASLDEIVEACDGGDLMELPEEVLAEIDEHLFTCDRCGWTQPSDQLAEDDDRNICEDCYQEEDD